MKKRKFENYGKFTKKQNCKERLEKGITLIALVITIIVLLILARSYNFCIKWG